MSMMTSYILKFVNFTKTQKSRYLENETLFFLQNHNNSAVLMPKFQNKAIAYFT